MAVLSSLSVLVALTTSAARPTYRADPDYLIDTWETEDGLPEDSATAMVQTPDGYLWFGTFNGLVRFDGVKFSVLNPNSTPQLPSAGIVNLHLDKTGKLWVSTYSGVAVLAGNQWRTVGQEDGWAGDFVRTFTERGNGDLLVTTFDGKVLEFSQGRFRLLPSPPGAPNQGYFGHVDAAGRWWVVQNRFIGRWDGERWVATVSPPAFSADQVGCGAARDGGLWLLLGKELRKYHNETEVSRIELSRVPGDFWSLSEDSRSNVWICTSANGFFQVSPSGQLRQWTASAGFSHHSTRFAFEDRENNVWVGTSGAGLMRFKRRYFQSFGAESGLGAGIVHSVWPDADEGVLIATYGKGLFRLWDAGVTRVALSAPSNAPSYTQSVLKDRAGRIWLGTFSGGLWLSETQGVREIPSSQTGGGNVLSLFEDSRDRIWMSGSQTASVYERGLFRVFTNGQGLPNGRVRCFAEGKAGEIWLAHPRGVFRLQNDRFVEVLHDGQPIREISCLKADADGTIWLGSLDRGLLRWRNGKLAAIDAATGFTVSAIHGILEDGQGFFWMTSDRGLVRASRTDLEQAADGKSSLLPFQTFDASDGLPSMEFTSGHQPASARDARGRLWFATKKGVASVNPAEFRHNKVAPPVQIEELVYYGTSSRAYSGETARSPSPVVQSRLRAPFPEQLTFPPGSRRLAIRYTALSFAAPEKVRFQIKLERGDSDWQDVGNRRDAYYYDFHPGDYVFRVRAANNDGVWNETGASLAFTVLPFFWQTWWFRIAAGFALLSSGAAATWLAARARLRRAGERERAAQAVHEIQERMDLAADAASLGMWVWDVPQNRLWASERYKQLFGYAPEIEMTEEKFRDRVHPEDRHVRDSAVQRALNQNEDYKCEYRVLLPDGVTRWIGAFGRAERDAGGKPVRMLGISMDITERKQGEEAVRESEARFRTVADTAPVLIWMAGTDKLCTFFNKGWLDFTGRTLEQELGNGWTEGVHPGDLAGCLEQYLESFDSQRPFTIEYRLRRHDGEYRGISDHGVPRYDSEGNFLGYIGSCADLTERKQAEEKFRLVVEASPNGIVLVNREGKMVLVNTQTEKLFGYTREELIGHEVEMLVPERFRGAHPGDRTGFFCAVFALRKNGTEFPVEIGLSPIQSEEGVLVLTAIVDITARKEAEAESLRQRAELAHVARVSTMGELAASVAHELNQPLGAILANAEAADLFINQNPPALDEVRAILTDIRKDDERASEVIRRMRALLRKHEMDRQPLEINSVVEDVLQVISGDAALRNMALQADLAPALPKILGDRVHLQQVLLNLILNSMDAMAGQPRERRRLAVRTRLDAAGAVELTVMDFGHGIDPEKFPRLFEPFFTTKPNGMGMGLSISNTIIEAHRGRISAENNASGGATFHVTLPVVSGGAKS